MEVDVNDEKKAWLAAVGMIAALLVAPAAVSAAEAGPKTGSCRS